MLLPTRRVTLAPPQTCLSDSTSVGWLLSLFCECWVTGWVLWEAAFGMELRVQGG